MTPKWYNWRRLAHLAQLLRRDDTIFWCGVLALSVGAALVYLPAGLIVCGIVLILAAIFYP